MTKPCSPAFSFSFSLKTRREFPVLPVLTGIIAEKSGEITEITTVCVTTDEITYKITVKANSANHQKTIFTALSKIENSELSAVSDQTFACHAGGKLAVQGNYPLTDAASLSRLYTPGVARICKAIAADKNQAFTLTQRRNMVAVISDGSAILGLGNLGPEAALPVMEGKALLFKEFANVDAFPIVLDTQNPEEIINIAAAVAPAFGGINLEDISAPRCFMIEEELQKRLDIPVFHDDQHGTAIVILAALKNALQVTGKNISNIKLVIAGIGAAGTACSRLLLAAGVKNIIGVDKKGAIYAGSPDYPEPLRQEYARITNPEKSKGSLKEVIAGADVFVGLAGPDILAASDIKKMAAQAIVFAMSNPDPEISPELALPHTAVMATGRSDYPNQINNVLAFPGLFRGALDIRARKITVNMQLAAAQAIATIAEQKGLKKDYIIPSVFDISVAEQVAKAVKEAGIKDQIARDFPLTPGLQGLSEV